MPDAALVDPSGRRQPGTFMISLDIVDGEAVVGVAGEVDMATAPELGTIAFKLCEQRHKRIVFDLSHVDFIDAAGLRVINETALRLRGQAGHLRLRSPSALTARILELVGMDELVEPETADTETTNSKQGR